MIDNLMKAGNPSSLTGAFDRLIIEIPFFYLILIALMIIVVLVIYKSKQLTISGTVTAFILGVVVVLGFGTGGLLVYIFFIAVAGVFSFLNHDNKIAKEAMTIQEKTGSRDWMQVLANGGLGLVLAMLYIIKPNNILILMFGASIAEAVSDTVAGEVGILLRGRTVSIITGQPQKPGLSGGVSVEGTLAGFVSSIVTAFLWYSCFFYPKFSSLTFFMVASISGFIGCLIDSVIGATIQAHYYDEKNDKITEKSHINGKALPLIKGLRFLDNDKVNLLSNLFAVIFAGFLGLSIQ